MPQPIRLLVHRPGQRSGSGGHYLQPDRYAAAVRLGGDGRQHRPPCRGNNLHATDDQQREATLDPERSDAYGTVITPPSTAKLAMSIADLNAWSGAQASRTAARDLHRRHTPVALGKSKSMMLPTHARRGSGTPAPTGKGRR